MGKEQVDALKKAMGSDRCSYPGCEKKSLMNVGLPIGKLTESGEIEFPNEGKNASVQGTAPLCNYHFAMSNTGLINLIEQDGLVRLVAPFPIIDVVEGVLKAKEFLKEMEKEIKKAKGKKK